MSKSWLFRKGYGERILKDNLIMIRCCIEGCGRIYKANKGSTSSIAYHLLSAHNISEFPGVTESGPIKPSQIKKLLRPKNKLMLQEAKLVCSSAFQYQKPEKLPTHLLSQGQENSFRGCIPFPVVQDESLMNLLQLADTCAANISLLPTDIRPSQYIDPNLKDFKLKLKKVLDQQASVSLSLSRVRDALFVTAHFIDEKWAAKEVLLSILSLKDGVMACDLASLLVQTLVDFQIHTKIFTITTDLSPATLILVDELHRLSRSPEDFDFQPHQHIPCLGHVINEVINGVLQVDLASQPLDPKAVIDSLRDFSGIASGSILERLSFLREGMSAIR